MTKIYHQEDGQITRFKIDDVKAQIFDLTPCQDRPGGKVVIDLEKNSEQPQSIGSPGWIDRESREEWQAQKRTEEVEKNQTRTSKLPEIIQIIEPAVTSKLNRQNVIVKTSY